MDISVLKALNEERRARRAVVLVTDLEDGSAMLVRENDAFDGEVGEALAKAFRTGNSGAVEADGKKFFFNAHLPQPRLVVIGAVHISQALAPMARIAGYPLEIIDPRSAFATPDRFPDTDLYPDWPETVLAQRPLDAYTGLAAVTHDPKIDDFALKAALDAGCFYVGALGSRKTHAKRVERLLALGATPEDIERIAAPIGLDIGAASPAEIAVAVLAQVVRTFRSRGLADAVRAPKGEAA
ncbi:XdhC family protein [Mesorhizobium sp. KR9-304]|uniref:XdhC family protein n=1 Tax=Mesorhizobium sp. KR9-304 TaxID=3156614 RepID=UPI0032B38F4C